MKILVVDDEPDIRTMLEAVLHSAGHEVDLASNGLEALERLPRTMPDLVLLDIHFPGYLNGIDICRRIKKNPAYAGTQVIIMTAEADRESVVSAVKAGAMEYLAKPFDMNVLRKKIASVLSRTRSNTPAVESGEEIKSAAAIFPGLRPRGSGLAAARATRDADEGN